MQRGDLETAGLKFAEAIRRDPDFAPAYNAAGLLFASRGDVDAAMEHYATAIRLDPDFASPYINRSVIEHRRGQIDAALTSLRRALELQPENPNANNNLGSLLTEIQRPLEAIDAFDRALRFDPNYPQAAGLRALNKMLICNWSGFTREIPRLVARLEHDEPAAPPWTLLALLDRPDLQRKVAEVWVAANAVPTNVLEPVVDHPKHERIRLGYYSSDFHRHATAHLIAEVLERHDRSKFEVFAFSYGPETGDDMEKRLKQGVDHFINVRAKSDRDVAALSREHEIDIAVDLKGITVGHRNGIFAHRAAPIQVNYLGYPATVGAPFLDYIIGDETVIPAQAHQFYTEKVVNLPRCYQPNDSQRQISDRTFTRPELGLPETGFVYCCFNNNFKIVPELFDIWMRLLHAVEGSVLWLIEDNALAKENLKWEAERRGIEAKRIVFAPRIAPDEHLARQRLADLFLDTFPYNAHTTASDALWAGLPVLTCPGESFASRVAASLLTAMDMPELIVQHFGEYEDLAVDLAKNPEKIAALKAKLERNRTTSPLFDAEGYARDIEAAYLKMIADHRSS